jgi:hypothetical protein
MREHNLLRRGASWRIFDDAVDLYSLYASARRYAKCAGFRRNSSDEYCQPY